MTDHTQTDHTRIRQPEKDKAEALRKARHQHVYKDDSCIICDRVFAYADSRRNLARVRQIKRGNQP